MPSPLDTPLNCHACGTAISVQNAFEIAYASWPNRSWIAYRCEICHVSNQLLVHDEMVAEGYLDGFPEPNFIVSRTVSIPGLNACIDAKAIFLSIHELSWNIPAKN